MDSSVFFDCKKVPANRFALPLAAAARRQALDRRHRGGGVRGRRHLVRPQPSTSTACRLQQAGPA